MPKRIVPLSDMKNQKAKSKDKPITLFDGCGLFLMITPWKAIRKRSWPSAYTRKYAFLTPVKNEMKIEGGWQKELITAPCVKLKNMQIQK